jgi:segregation and condensation protein B
MDDLETQPLDTPEPEPEPESPQELPQTVSIEEWMAASQPSVPEPSQTEALEDVQLRAVLEACVYVAEEPVMPAQLAAALNEQPERIRTLMQDLIAEYDKPEHGISIKEVAGGYKMATKAEHHEAVRSFVKSLKAPLKLSLPALETLAVVAYKQPVTGPEIMEVRGVQGGGVLKTLLDRKLITEAGRKNVIGKPILYKTTKEFLIQFGLKDLNELPTLKEFEEIRRMAMSDNEAPEAEAAAPETAVPTEAEVPAVDAAARADEEAPATDAPEAEAAAPEAPRTDAPEAEADAPEVPTAEAAVADAPAPDAEALAVEVPHEETPAETPAAEAPAPSEHQEP